MAVGYQVLITVDGGLSLGGFPWHLLTAQSPKIATETIKWSELSEKLLSEMAAKYRLLFLVADPQNSDQTRFLEALAANKELANLAIFSIYSGAAPATQNQKLQPIDSSLRQDFIVSYIDKYIVSRYYQMKYEASSADEIEWLTRIEKIFDLTREEITASDMTATAYENLVKYEERLLQEQRRVNQALESLQEYRDQHKIDWIKEREAREVIEALMSKEIKDRNEQLKAQEMLLQYTAQEREALYNLMQMFKTKGSLSKEEVEELLAKQNVLLRDMERLTRLNQPGA